jgi:hypothetical protein
MQKMINDHSHIRGFSFRNIHRNLPPNNPAIPHRIVTKRHKSIATNNNGTEKLSTSELQDNANKHQSQNREGIQSTDCHKLVTQNHESKEIIRSNTALIAADQIPSFKITFKIHSENYEMILFAINNSKEFIRIVFDKDGVLLGVESDVVQSKT